MSNLIDYVRQYGNESFEDKPLGELDKMVLNEIVYLPFNRAIEALWDTKGTVRLQDYQESLEAIRDQIETGFIITEERIELFYDVVNAHRYASLEISEFAEEYSSEFEKQFAAATLTLPELGYRQVVFRGTDDTFIGWKEDFNMTFMSEIPAQRSAKDYLNGVLSRSALPVTVSGHSKGGNLALYAASFVDADYQNKITEIYCLDAPGLHEAPLAKDGYRAIKDRIIAIQPKDSMIGVMLDLGVEARVIEANQFGMNQHNMLNWLVEDDHFIPSEDGASLLSIAFGETCRQWIVDLSSQELKTVVDSVFDLFLDNGIESIDELPNLSSQKVSGLYSALKDMPNEKRNLVTKSLKHMFSIFVDAAINYLKEDAKRSIEHQFGHNTELESSEEEQSWSSEWLPSLTNPFKGLSLNKELAEFLPRSQFMSLEWNEKSEAQTEDKDLVVNTVIEDPKSRKELLKESLKARSGRSELPSLKSNLNRIVKKK